MANDTPVPPSQNTTVQIVQTICTAILALATIVMSGLGYNIHSNQSILLKNQEKIASQHDEVVKLIAKKEKS